MDGLWINFEKTSYHITPHKKEYHERYREVKSSQELKAQKFLSVTAPKQEKIYNKIVELDSLALQSPRFH